MSPKQKLVTMSWCVVTMIATTLLSHGHLIMKEVLAHWPTESSWEGRLESALYTQGGITLLASLVLSCAMFVRGVMLRRSAEAQVKRELAVRERHERAAEKRHEALLSSLNKMMSRESQDIDAAKKVLGSGNRPR